MFLRLVELLSKFKGKQPPEEFDKLREWTSTRRKPPVVEDLLGSSCLTVWAADCSTGKSMGGLVMNSAKPSPLAASSLVSFKRRLAMWCSSKKTNHTVMLR